MPKFKIILLTFGYFLLIQPVKALTPTPNTDQIIRERVQERIENIQTAGKKKAFWGILKNRSNSVLIIDSGGEEKRLKTDSATTYSVLGKKELKITDLEIGHFLIGLGYWQENGTLNTRRVITLLTAPKPAPKRETIIGKIINLENTKRIIQMENPINQTLTKIQLNSSTKIFNIIDNKPNILLFKTLAKEDMIIVVGTIKEDGETITAKLIYLNSPAQP